MKTRFKIPNTYVLISGFIVLMAVLTWIIPAGKYNTIIVNGKETVDSKSFHYIDNNPQFINDILVAPITGFIETAEIIIFILVVGGAFGIFAKTEAINAAIIKISGMHEKSPFLKKWLIPIIMIIFSLGGAVFGMSEEVIPFILVFVPLAILLGYDTITGVAIPFVGAGAGFAGAFMNPFTIGIAQGISGLPLFSGFEYRIFCWIVLTLAAIVFVMKYANKIKKDPAKSPTYELDLKIKENLSLNETEKFKHLDKQHKIVLTIFFLGMVVLVFGVIKYQWFIKEICAVFLGTGLAIGIAARLNSKEITDSFLEGAKDLFGTALIVGLARGILVIARQGGVVDTILFNLSQLIDDFHPVISSHIMFVVQSVINFFIPSGSGKAALTMPIMAPLSDLIGLSRQTTVLAYQFGDGFTNLIVPTSPVTMAILALAKIPWEKWAKWIIPLQIIWFILALLLLIPPYFINY